MKINVDRNAALAGGIALIILAAIMLGFWVALNHLADTYILKLGYLEFPSMWASVVAVLLIGLGIAIYRKVKNE